LERTAHSWLSGIGRNRPQIKTDLIHSEVIYWPKTTIRSEAMRKTGRRFDKTGSTAVALLLLLFAVSGVAGQAVRRGLARVNGAKLYYEMKGKGPTLVLIHGGQMDRRMWDMQFDLFAGSYRVIRYDVRGYGKSDVPRRGFAHEDDLFELLRLLGADKVSIIGLSLGGRIAIDFAIKHPQMVESLVLAGPGLSGFKFSDQSGWSIVEAARDEGLTKAAEMWLKHPYMAPAMENPAIRQKIRQLAIENGHVWLENPIFEREMKPPAIERLSQIRVPTLIVVGDRDVEDIQKIVDTLKGGISGSEKLVIRGAGHIVNMEKPEQFNQVVLEFLGKKRSPLGRLIEGQEALRAELEAGGPGIGANGYACLI
jgi:pimeloyl-ACP methyl ester carboxylesterase